MSNPIRVTVWNEFRHEQSNQVVKELYPQGIHGTIQSFLEKQLGDAVTVQTATLDEPEHGLTDEVLEQTDVMTWWGHCAHGEVSDAIVEKVQQRVHQGMGLLVLHSGHNSKIFKRLMGTTCSLTWREQGEREILWNVNPAHPITDGLTEEHFELAHTEMYGELFDIPAPEEQIFISWFEGGEIFRSGCTWTRGKGRIFYFRPGHETFPIYHDANIQRVIANGVKWAHRPSSAPYREGCPNITESLAPIAGEYEVDASLHEH